MKTFNVIFVQVFSSLIDIHISMMSVRFIDLNLAGVFFY
jgi:hypothetical protein